MSITGLNHITINVVDLEKSKAFYEKVLGLEQSGFINMGDHTLTYYALPQGVLLELIDYETKDEPAPVPVTHVGMYRHFCLEADDLEEIERRCLEAGILVTSAPAWVEKLGKTNMLLIDPNGVELEIFLKEC